MYVDDERFKTNIDKAGQGTAQYLSDAIAYYTLNKDWFNYILGTIIYRLFFFLI